MKRKTFAWLILVLFTIIGSTNFIGCAKKDKMKDISSIEDSDEDISEEANADEEAE